MERTRAMVIVPYEALGKSHAFAEGNAATIRKRPQAAFSNVFDGQIGRNGQAATDRSDTQNTNAASPGALTSGAITVSNRLSRCHSRSPLRVIFQASMAGPAPTTTNRRPPGFRAR